MIHISIRNFNVVIIFFSLLSMICSLILIWTINQARAKKNFRIKRDHMSNILWMSVSDFGVGVSYVMQGINNIAQIDILKSMDLCKWSALLSVFFHFSDAGLVFCHKFSNLCDDLV